MSNGLGMQRFGLMVTVTGLVLDETTGRLYSHEHGAKGGDELNLIKPAANYGWPAVTKGINYSGAYVSPLRSAPGIEEPLTYWDPSIGASGLAIYEGDAFPEWQGKLFIGALVDEEVACSRSATARSKTSRPYSAKSARESAMCEPAQMACCICSPTASKARLFGWSRPAMPQIRRV